MRTYAAFLHSARLSVSTSIVMKCSWASDNGMMRGGRNTRNGGEQQTEDTVRMITDRPRERSRLYRAESESNGACRAECC